MTTKNIKQKKELFKEIIAYNEEFLSLVGEFFKKIGSNKNVVNKNNASVAKEVKIIKF